MNATPVASAVPPWRPPPAALALTGEDVHVWQTALDQPPFQIEGFWKTLAADERARAGRFHFENDRTHFVVARGVLRAILGRYLNCAPGGLCFCYGSHGKPALAVDSDIRFNVSHSHGLALYAVARGREVGIDVERVRGDLGALEIAERFFAPREVAALRALPAGQRHDAFFRVWTRKEAYVKARGEGLSLLSERLDVSVARGASGALARAVQDPGEAGGWSMMNLAPAPGYAACVAVQGHGWQLACLQWPGAAPPSV